MIPYVKKDTHITWILCDLHEWVIHFIQDIKHDWMRFLMENLYNLRTLVRTT